MTLPLAFCVMIDSSSPTRFRQVGTQVDCIEPELRGRRKRLSKGKWTDARISPTRLMIVIGVLALVVPLFFVDWFWIRKSDSARVILEDRADSLITLEIAYGVALLVAGLAIPVLAFGISAVDAGGSSARGRPAGFCVQPRC